jgi:hypothetical protein
LQLWLVAGFERALQRLSWTTVPSAAWHVTVRTWVPPPHVTLHALNAEGTHE